MEAITRLVSESLARHGFDRPLDYRRLHWSRWFRCESTHSLLVVPSKPGVFALAEEIMDLPLGTAHVGADAEARPERAQRVGRVRPAERSSAEFLGGAALQRCDSLVEMKAASAAEVTQRRMLAVTQFFEDDDMAFVLDRMLIRQRSRLASGGYFVRFVVIEDELQRRSICAALNQWIANQSIANQTIANSAEKAGSIGSDFASSLELTPATEYVASDAQATLFDDAHVGRTLLSANAGSVTRSKQVGTAAWTMSPAPPNLDSGAAANIHCPAPFPSGF